MGIGARLLAVGRELAATPLLWLTITVLVYQAAGWLYRRAAGFPLLNPVLVSVALVVALLLLTGTPYDVYFDGARLIHFLLGPATVALAVPLARYARKLRRMGPAILVTLLVGSVVAVLAAVGLGRGLGLSGAALRSFAPKSVTTPIAMGVAEEVGGIPSLTAVLVILTGIVGAMTAGPLLALLRVREPAVRGFAIGVASHGIGTARAFQMSEEAGAFSGLGMGLNGMLTAFLVPLFAHWLGW